MHGIRIRIAAITGAAVLPSLTAGSLYPAFMVVFEPDYAVNMSCPGCEESACIVLDRIEVWGTGSEPNEIITTPDVHKWCTWQGGGVAGAMCPAAVPVRNATWGAVKRSYR